MKISPSSPSTSSRSEPSNLGQGRAGEKSDGRKIEFCGIGNPIEIGQRVLSSTNRVTGLDHFDII